MITFDLSTGRPSATSPLAFAQQARVLPGTTAPISRRVVAIALVLALLTGLVAGQLASVLHQPFEIAPVQGSGRLELLAADYYDAANGLLAGDGSDRFEAIVGADYVGHVDVSQTLERKDELLAHLEDLHSAFPRARMETQVVSSSVDLAVMRVEVVGATQGMLLGTALQRPNPAPHIETLRFAGDRLVERWGAPASPVNIEQLGSTIYEPTIAVPMRLRLERITLAADGLLSLPANTNHLVLVESGTVTLLGSDRPMRTATPVDIQPGELTVAAGSGPYRLTNSEQTGATFLLLRLVWHGPDEGAILSLALPAASKDVGANRITLATSAGLTTDREPWKVTLTRVTLQAGVAIGTHLVDGVEIVALENGKLFVSGSACDSRCVETHDGRSAVITDDLHLEGTEGFAAARGAEVSYEPAGAGETTFLMITIARI
jgi:hypothetical protein